MDNSGLVSDDARPYPWESAGVQPMSFPNYQHIVTYSFYLSNFAISQLSHGCCCNLVRECGARVTNWCRLKAISWRYGVCRSVYLWDSWWGGTSTDLYICEANAMSHSSRQFWWEHCTNFIRSWSLWYVRQYNGRNRELMTFPCYLSFYCRWCTVTTVCPWVKSFCF